MNIVVGVVKLLENSKWSKASGRSFKNLKTQKNTWA
jgi:hypothetical protein